MTAERALLDPGADHGPIGQMWRGDHPALLTPEGAVSRAALREQIAAWKIRLDREVPSGAVVALVGDFAAEPIALLLALLTSGRVAVPFTPEIAEPELQRRLSTSCASLLVRLDQHVPALLPLRPADPHPLLTQLRARHHAGLLLFSSGSTGRAKATLLDADVLLTPRSRPAPPARAISFLRFDHIGGLHTLFRVLSDGGTLVPLRDRDPDHVCATITRLGVELLPTTPTFLRMLLISRAYTRHDLSSLKRITYGTEPMPAATLSALAEALPHVSLKQTYGLSEAGIVPTRSREDGSTWLKLGGEGVETRVVDGTLRVRAPGALVGYLDAPSPLDADGWLDTGDMVEIDGEYLRFLGRRTEIINVGGSKVQPTEVESVLLGLDNIAEARVSGRPSPVTGQVVVATVSLREPEEPRALSRRVRAWCRERLPAYAVPVLVDIHEGVFHGERFKKLRETP